MRTKTETVVIANGASLSGAVDLLGMLPVAILMPAAWSAAALTFDGSLDGVTFTKLYDGNTEVSEAVASGRWQVLDRDKYRGMTYLRIRSGTWGTPVNQAAERTLTVLLEG